MTILDSSNLTPVGARWNSVNTCRIKKYDGGDTIIQYIKEISG